jgi:hypothetical protein
LHQAPHRPTAVATDRQATVTVAAATGVTPTGYTVTASPGGATCTVTGASGSCTITGLTNGTAYTFTAVARNGDTSSSASVASNSVTPTRTAPTFVSATNTTAGTQLYLITMTLLASPLPTASMFTVLENGVAKTISTVGIATDKVTLTLSSAIQKNSVVSVSYAAPDPVNDSTSVAAIQDSIGNDAASLPTTTFTNSSTTDSVAPQLVSSVIPTNGNSIILTYNETQCQPSDPYWDNFNLFINNGAALPSYNLGSITASGSTLTISLSGVTVQASDIVKLTYKASGRKNN